MAEIPPLPSFAAPDLWLDDCNVLEFVHWKDEPEPYMAFWWHRATTRESGWCHGGFQWRRPDPIIDGPLWTLESWDPLTISPSLLCLSCRSHGFIRAGKWVAV